MSHPDDIVLVEGARTAVGTYGGAFASTDNYLLGAAAIKAALGRAGVEPTDVDEVILGCVGQVGPDAFNARRASLAAGLPESVNAYNVNRLCGSGLQAIWSASMEIRTGAAELVVAGGNENMTRQPFLDYYARDGYRLGHRRAIDGTLSLVTDPWGEYPMGVTAENVAQKFAVSREDQDEFALLSQKRASAAQQAGRFEREIEPVTVRSKKTETMVAEDEHIRPDATLERLARLRPAFADGGSVTAGNSSGINDGAAAVIVTSAATAERRGLRPLARVVAFAKGAVQPEIMGIAPVVAIQRVLEASGRTVDDVDLFEVNEAFAAQALAVVREAGLDLDRVNQLGGAIALGHPVGATGAILALRAMYQLVDQDLQTALVTLCIGGGQAVAALIERC